MKLANGKINISFIGLDGSGKGTYINLLRDEFDKKNISYKYCYLGYSHFQIGILKKIVNFYANFGINIELSF